MPERPANTPALYEIMSARNGLAGTFMVKIYYINIIIKHLLNATVCLYSFYYEKTSVDYSNT